ncbi:MAG: SWIM zinc finger family protein [Leptospiraceae bacterium]|nr:SWIM zinc finger family protein [Leptospiraceae bacterium]MCP5499156.1 SWIM zinc finger family protein [Leptospiraceae bacterium]
MNWTEEQVLALSPDASSTKAGKGLANARKWVSYAVNEKALWGECQGSGKNPYRTKIDLQNIAFSCSCPSRKFPCKHGLGLFLLYVNQSSTFKTTEEPDWVKEWLDKRQASEEKKKAPKKPVDEKAKAKRTEAKEKKIQEGILELQDRLQGMIRVGLLDTVQESHFWETARARMVDSQATGLAAMLRSLSDINFNDDSWKSLTLKKICRIYLTTEGHKNINSQAEDLQEELRSLIGWPQNQDELKLQEGIKDTYLILSKKVEQEDNLSVQSNWLYGKKTKRFALILSFAVGSQIHDVSLMPGLSIEAELVFFPGVAQYRALVKTKGNNTEPFLAEGFKNLEEVQEAYSDLLSINPWLDRVPLILENVAPVYDKGSLYLKDSEGRFVSVEKGFPAAWELLALSGGRPLTMALLRKEDEFLPLGAWQNKHYIIF